MTDASLMDANCIHGVVWFECKKCFENYDEDLKRLAELDDNWEDWEF